MDMFTVDDNIARWERALLPLRGMARLPILLSLAWHLRQRDGARALALADEALALLDEADLSDRERASFKARMALVQAENTWLQGKLDEAIACCRRHPRHLHPTR